MGQSGPSVVLDDRGPLGFYAVDDLLSIYYLPTDGRDRCTIDDRNRLGF